MKLSDLKQLIKEELLAEAKKDKSGLPFALAANIEKYGKPQTPKGAKPTHFTKGEEKRVKKTAEKLKKHMNEDLGNYMFFQNLKTIKQMVDELLKLDEKMVDAILSNGHDWAEDHIATSKDDIEEVANFMSGYFEQKNLSEAEKKSHKLCSRGISAAKSKFKVYPSAYASAWLVREYKRRGGGYRNVSKGDYMKKVADDLTEDEAMLAEALVVIAERYGKFDELS